MALTRNFRQISRDCQDFRVKAGFVIELQLSGELQQVIAFEIDLPGISEFPIFQNGGLGE
jgi:hypothetical protein